MAGEPFFANTRNFTYSELTVPSLPGFATASPTEFVVADFNGDGKLDVVLAYLIYPLEDRASPIRVLLGDGAGGFTEGTTNLFPSNAPSAVHPRQMLVADFNRDGRPDLFIADHGYDAPPYPGFRNTLILSSGATALVNASGSLPTQPDFSHSAATADIDGDNDLDILVGNTFGGQLDIYFLINDGQGGFARSTGRLPAEIEGRFYGRKFTASLLFDADGDGDKDLFLGLHSGEGSLNSELFLNDGSGRFLTAPTLVPSPVGARGGVMDATALDLNRDGRLDLVLTYEIDSYQSGRLQVLINHGSGGFVDETAARIGDPTNPINWSVRTIVADINGDGHADLLLGNMSDQPLYLNDGTGRFVQMPLGVMPGNRFDQTRVGDLNGDGRLDLFAVRGRETVSVRLAKDPGLVQTGDDLANGFMGDSDAETFDAGGGGDIVFAGAGADTIKGGGGDDRLFGGEGEDSAVWSSASANYSWWRTSDGSWQVRDARAGSPDGSDTLMGIERLVFADRTIKLAGATNAEQLALAYEQIMRVASPTGADATFLNGLIAAVDGGQKTLSAAYTEIVQKADGSTAVAAMTYQFFVGFVPSKGGFDYLVNPTGPNPNNINSAYYQFFSTENRYINFAVNVGSAGDGKAAFQAEYGALTLRQATAKAYQEIFGGAAPNEAFLSLLLDASVGGGMTRKDYFAYYGKDGPDGLGTKAAMVGWLLTEAAKADLGVLARSSNAYLADLADGAEHLIDIVGVYAQSGWAHNPPT